jgi:predicted transcriptional regulator
MNPEIILNSERAMFRDIVGDTPEARIIDFLLLHPNTSHTLAKVVEGTDLNFRTAKRRMENLEALGIVKIDYEDKKSKFYMIDMDHLLGEFEKIGDFWKKY